VQFVRREKNYVNERRWVSRGNGAQKGPVMPAGGSNGKSSCARLLVLMLVVAAVEGGKLRKEKGEKTTVTLGEITEVF